MKVMISAYACAPGCGSEPGVGWNWARQIARFHEVWVITRAGNRQAIAAALAQEPLPNAHFVYFDLPRWAYLPGGGRVAENFRYYFWQVGAYFVARRLHRQVGFDIAHHVTLGCYWRPSVLALLPAPFAWGPVGGGESAPKAFRTSFSLRGRIFECLRDAARLLGELDPFVRLTARRAAWAFATTEESAARMRALGCRRVSVLSQVALPTQEIELLGEIPPHRGNPFRLLTLGRLVHWKGFALGLQAFAQFHREFPASEYWLIGDGPERNRLEKVTRELRVADRVTFWGALPRSEALAKLGACDVLVHASLHEAGGYACLEAMAAGRPVICLDLGGPALQVTEETGIKVAALSPEQTIPDLAAAIHKLATDSRLSVRMSKAAGERVRKQFDWGRKALYMMELYDAALGATRTETSPH